MSGKCSVEAERPAAVSVEALLLDDEQLLESFETDQRTVAVTSQRLVLVDHSGVWSAIGRFQVAAVEVLGDGAGAAFVRILLGGDASWTLPVRTAREAYAIADALS